MISILLGGFAVSPWMWSALHDDDLEIAVLLFRLRFGGSTNVGDCSPNRGWRTKE
ncbi:hypothetical protein [Tabrizicola sp.]|uniref:hypothetical protein n=1 Tax=Tabrizicola sp. TaxID=2005166 RepID=UPI001A569A2A|nr:hypothetical protein [Tabrizicola sp.]MBL9063256.1 hypothetical protein [Tabrizicola sp.]